MACTTNTKYANNIGSMCGQIITSACSASIDPLLLKLLSSPATVQTHALLLKTTSYPSSSRSNAPPPSLN